MLQNISAKEQFGKILQLKRFFNHVLRAGNFQTLSNFSPRKFPVFHFSYPEELLVLFFSREIGSLWFVALNIRVLAENVSSVFLKVPSRCERERSFFSGYSTFFSWNLRIICRRLGKKLGTFLHAAKYLCRRTTCHLFPEKMLFISVLWARNLSNSEKNFSKKVLSFLFFVCRGPFGTNYQRFKLFLDLSLNVWASEEHFSTVFSKMHSRCGSVFLEPALFLSKVGQKSCGCFVKAAKNVRRRTIWFLFPEKILFRFSTLSGKLPDFGKNFSKKYSVFHFLWAKEKLGSFFQMKSSFSQVLRAENF